MQDLTSAGPGNGSHQVAELTNAPGDSEAAHEEGRREARSRAARRGPRAGSHSRLREKGPKMMQRNRGLHRREESSTS